METIKLPEPEDTNPVYLKEILNKRSTVRAFNKGMPLSLQDLSYVLWSAYGFKKDRGRTVPSAGALYPLDIYIACGEIISGEKERIPAALYHYIPEKHQLNIVRTMDLRKDIAKASLSQMWTAEAPCLIIITAEYERITFKYRDRGIRYALMEAGNVSQNIFLSSFNKGLACGIVGAFDDNILKTVLGVKKSHEPLLVMPIGYRYGK
ncbi:MAG: SagB/ThcOx family dehydrogenase [Syntrophorhabdaceae bacterium]|nr:SagB/ThcOx family dehydrogenase [Syntrophorhabdales bacterium]MBP9560810.1 SagB/ThcOx family dehydrogenase [Syntrophorhabdaceae bacterium]